MHLLPSPAATSCEFLTAAELFHHTVNDSAAIRSNITTTHNNNNNNNRGDKKKKNIHDNTKERTRTHMEDSVLQRKKKKQE